MNINIKNGILIIDEAHNIQDVCCNSYSKDIALTVLERAIKELSKFKNDYKNDKFKKKEGRIQNEIWYKK